MNRLLELARRGRVGYSACAATIDLLGMKRMMATNPHEAIARLDDLHQGFGNALGLHPGGSDYRVCLAADTVFVIQELEPEEDPDERWEVFCGHLFLLASSLNELDQGIGNAGVRMFAAVGPLFQLRDPQAWQSGPWSSETQNWFALTGASVGLAKCGEAEQLGSSGGFRGPMCWFEDPARERVFQELPFRSGAVLARDPAHYREVYQEMRARSLETATLPAGWRPTDQNR